MGEVAGVFRARYNRQAKLIRSQWLIILALALALVYSLVAQPFIRNTDTSTKVAQTPTVMPSATLTEFAKIKPFEPFGPIPTEPLPAEPVSLGEFKLTAFCACEKCCGKAPSDPAYGITAYGYQVTAGRTIAVDPKVIPIGTEVIINGHTYVAEDVGGAIKDNRIDIYFNTHQEALEFGVQYAEVFINQ